MSTVLDILVRARAKVARSWGQGQRRDRLDPDSCCAAEAIEESDPRPNDLVSFDSPRVAAYRAFARAAGFSIVRHAAFVDWNDHPMRTKIQVLTAFDKAIASVI